MRHLIRPRLLLVLLVLSALSLVLVGRWVNATKLGGQEPAEPFRIAGNFYYVGANDVAAFLEALARRRNWERQIDPPPV